MAEYKTIDDVTNVTTDPSNDDLLLLWSKSRDKTTKITFFDLMKNASSGKGLAFVGTQAEYEVAKLIPAGNDGYIPEGSLVKITDIDDYIYGKEVEVN